MWSTGRVLSRTRDGNLQQVNFNLNFNLAYFSSTSPSPFNKSLYLFFHCTATHCHYLPLTTGQRYFFKSLDHLPYGASSPSLPNIPSSTWYSHTAPAGFHRDNYLIAWMYPSGFMNKISFLSGWVSHCGTKKNKFANDTVHPPKADPRPFQGPEFKLWSKVNRLIPV
ncbi:hypothetical protein EI94DRAFT_1716833 [Lactarius quietus]|nr:hypothetical protein EI94DRAFT_1716833 [Lactarius quietus]